MTIVGNLLQQDRPPDLYRPRHGCLVRRERDQGARSHAAPPSWPARAQQRDPEVGRGRRGGTGDHEGYGGEGGHHQAGSGTEG